MTFTQITQIDKNKFEINHSGIPERLTFLGNSRWVLTIGINSIENLRNGLFKRVKFNSLEELEMKHPKWKGISMIISSECPHQAGLVRH